jgi:PAS domain S-box-containing protein
VSQPKGPGDKSGQAADSKDHHSSYKRTPGPDLTEPHPGKSGNVLEQILERIEEGVCVADSDGIVVYINNTMCSMIGKSKHEFSGKDCYSYFRAAGYEKWQSEDIKVFATGKDSVRIDKIVTPNNREFFAKIRKTRITEENKDYVITIIRYVTGDNVVIK